MSNQPTSAAIDPRALEPRFPASAVPSITGTRLSPGDAVDLVNISRSGVLVEGRTRFLPGTSVSVKFEGTFAPSLVAGRVVRCQVSSISGGALTYRSAIQFDDKLERDPGEEMAPASAGDAEAWLATLATAPSSAVAPANRRAVNRW